MHKLAENFLALSDRQFLERVQIVKEDYQVVNGNSEETILYNTTK